MRNPSLLNRVPKWTTSYERGFTLVEILIALVILATSLTVILGLQSAVIDRTVTANLKKQALLATREILSAVEAREADGNHSRYRALRGTPQDLLGTLLEVPYEPPYEIPEGQNILRAEMVVEYWGIPNVSEKAMKRIQLTVRWGETIREQLTTTLFIPFDEDQLASVDDEDDDGSGASAGGGIDDGGGTDDEES